jgi:glycosyltransferase involved in cell wall biosynthesis
MNHLDWVIFANRSGYAQASQDYIDALRPASNFNLHVTLLHGAPDQLSVSAERYRETVRLLNNPLDDEKFIQIFHCIPLMQPRAWRGGRSIGFATFETRDVPDEWISQLNKNDAVICPSNFNVKAFAAAGVNSHIAHIPHVINTARFNPQVQKSRKYDKFTFLYFGSWKRRKGWRELFEAYFREFTAKDDVQLLIKTDRLAESNKAINDIRKKMGLTEKDTAPILYETRVLNELELPCFIKSVDCLVSPTYGEGFGLPGLQCMAVGVPIIITDYSGCQEYATDDTATLLKPDGFILYNEMDNIPQFANKLWANVSVDAVRRAMRSAINEADKVKQKAATGAQYVAENFNYQTAVDRFSKLMEMFE